MGADWLDRTTASAKRLMKPGKGPTEAIPCLTIIYHPDLGRVGDFLLLVELMSGRVAQVSRTQPAFTSLENGSNRPLADPYISRKSFSFGNAKAGGIRLTLPLGQHFLVEGAPAEGEIVFTTEEIRRGIVLEVAERVVLLLHRFAPDCETGPKYSLIGQSESMVQVRADIAHVADVDTSVLLQGETGSGKELVARAIHDHGKRKSGPFVGVNMAAIPTSLAASELFGAERGAYTGLNRPKIGFFQAAHRGTLFLDEIGETPAEIQVMLLRVLETREVFPVGSQSPRKVDVRLLAATDADLDQMIATGHFRSPLLHRLSGYSIWIAPLRHRREDFGLLLAHFLRVEAERVGARHRLDYRDPYAQPWLPAPLVGRLVRYDWPGNVRQLQNVVGQLVIGNRSKQQIAAGPPLQRLLASVAEHSPKSLGSRPIKPSAIPEKDLLEALRHHRWQVKATAAFLGISRTSLHARLEACPSVRKARDIGVDEAQRCFANCNGDVAAMVAQLEVSEVALRRRLKELHLG